MDGKQLRALFQQFNAQYFNGRLPAYSLRANKRSTWLGESGMCFRKRRFIKVSRGLPDEEATSTLLHEMAHAATNDGHGVPWKREMIRLREAGAPLVTPDLAVSLDDWDGRHVSRAHFRGAIEDMPIGSELNAGEFTLNEAIKNFVRSVGGAGTSRRVPTKVSLGLQSVQRCPKGSSRISKSACETDLSGAGSAESQDLMLIPASELRPAWRQ